MWIKFVELLMNPEVAGGLFTLLVAVLVHNKLVDAKDVQFAKNMLTEGKAVSEITDVVNLTAPAVKVIQVEMESPDTNRKKVQRTARTLLRGWLRF
jgi:hypothetical protein